MLQTFCRAAAIALCLTTASWAAEPWEPAVSANFRLAFGGDPSAQGRWSAALNVLAQREGLAPALASWQVDSGRKPAMMVLGVPLRDSRHQLNDDVVIEQQTSFGAGETALAILAGAAAIAVVVAASDGHDHNQGIVVNNADGGDGSSSDCVRVGTSSVCGRGS